MALLKDRITDRARVKIRERAIKRAKARIALRNRRIEDFSEDELEVLVAEEEEKLVKRLGFGSLSAVLILLGLQ